MSAIPQWLARFGISPGGTWADHIARGSRGGVDFPAPVGTPIRAPRGGGRLTFHMLGDGSSVARVTRPDGTCTEFLHHTNRNGVARDVVENEVMALSGGIPGTWGAGTTHGPHIHVHDKTTGAALTRVYPYSTVPDGGSGGGGIPIANPKDEDMFRLVHIDGSAYMVGPSGIRTLIAADPTNYHLNLCKRVLASIDAGDKMAKSEVDIVAAYQAKVTPPVVIPSIEVPPAELPAAIPAGWAEAIGAEVIRQQKLPGN